MWKQKRREMKTRKRPTLLIGRRTRTFLWFQWVPEFGWNSKPHRFPYLLDEFQDESATLSIHLTMCLFLFFLLFSFTGSLPAVSDGFDNFHPPSTPLSAHPPSSYAIHSQHQQHHHQQQQQQQQQLYSNAAAMLHPRGPTLAPQQLHLHSAIAGSPANAHHHQFHHHHSAGPSSAMAALLSGGGPSVPTSVIQAPSTASPISSGGGSPSGGEDSYFSELYNLGGGVGVGGGYSGQSGLESPHRRKKMKKQRNPDGPDGCPSGKRKNREGTRLDLFNIQAVD